MRIDLFFNSGALDRAEIRHWLVEGVGEDDPRVARWDALCRELPVD